MGTARKLVGEVAASYRRHVRGRPVEASFIATLVYLATLVITRLVTETTRDASHPAEITIAGVHLHHVVFGVILLLVAGVFALDELLRLPRAVLFGAGAALVLDEFALIVYLRDVYWLPQGSLSVVVVLIGFAALVVNAWRGRRFLAEAGGATVQAVRSVGPNTP